MGVWDRTTTEYHLTPRGWIEGNFWTFGKLSGEEVQRPDDAVETWKREMKQASGYSKEEVSWHRTWKSKDAPSPECAALHKEFPRPD